MALPALAIGAGGALLGGLFGRKKKRRPDISADISRLLGLEQELRAPVTAIPVGQAPDLATIMSQIGGGGLTRAVREARGLPGAAAAAAAAGEALGARAFPMFAQLQEAALQRGLQATIEQRRQQLQREALREQILSGILQAQAGLAGQREAGRAQRESGIISAIGNLLGGLF